MDEAWRRIPGFTAYEVSDHGRIRSWLRPGSPHPIRLARVSGYPAASLKRDDGRRDTVCVHAAVLLAFIGPRPPGMECCHYNGVKTDNRLENLRWDTRVANAADKKRHGSRFGTSGCQHQNARFGDGTARVISMFRALPDSERPLQSELAAAFRVDASVVSQVWNARDRFRWLSDEAVDGRLRKHGNWGPRGRNHPKTKLNEERFAEMARAAAVGSETQRAIAKRFGVSQKMVWRARREVEKENGTATA